MSNSIRAVIWDLDGVIIDSAEETPSGMAPVGE